VGRLGVYVLCCVAACGGAPAKQPGATSTSDAPAVEKRKPPAGPPKSIDCGDFTTCAVAEGGEARCWGGDKMGELGDGGGGDRSTNVGVPGMSGVVSVAMASQFGCALGDDKKVRCWGTGQIANDGKKREKAKATEVAGVDGAIELVASGVIACARSETAITCWGADNVGTPPKGTWKQIAAGINHACAIDKAGAVSCWGKDDWAAPKGAYAKPAITGATFVATGDRHACVIGKDKKVSCWGSNDAGQLGPKPDADAHKKPVVVPGVTNAVKLAAGEASTCALLADGSVKCWGEERPGATSLKGVADLCLASEHVCGLTKDGQILCAGANQHGQLGDGTTERKISPTPVAW
jgi:hypothetical protein